MRKRERKRSDSSPCVGERKVGRDKSIRKRRGSIVRPGSGSTHQLWCEHRRHQYKLRHRTRKLKRIEELYRSGALLKKFARIRLKRRFVSEQAIEKDFHEWSKRVLAYEDMRAWNSQGLDDPERWSDIDRLWQLLEDDVGLSREEVETHIFTDTIPPYLVVQTVLDSLGLLPEVEMFDPSKPLRMPAGWLDPR